MTTPIVISANKVWGRPPRVPASRHMAAAITPYAIPQPMHPRTTINGVQEVSGEIAHPRSPCHHMFGFLGCVRLTVDLAWRILS